MNNCEINLELNFYNLKKVICSVINGEKYTHYQIANWCSKYIDLLDEYDPASNNDEILKTIDIAGDIDAQWELYIINSVPINELGSIDLNLIYLPKEWFIEWKRELTEHFI